VVVACGAGGELGVTVTVGVAASEMTTVLGSAGRNSKPAVIPEIPRMSLFLMMPPGLMVNYQP
jgi:hypothetical protein